MKNKIYLSGITYPAAIDGIKANVIPAAKHFDGLNFVVNCGDANQNKIDLIELLDRNKGDGFIHIQDWIDRYDFARNRYLLDPRVMDGDILVIVDSLEKLDEGFAEISIPKLADFMGKNDIDVIFLHGKTFMVRKNEGMTYVNAVHEQVRPINRAVELTQCIGYEDSSKYFKNTRPEVRDDNHWVKDCHFLKYYCYSPIQCLMGSEGNQPQYQARVMNRAEFKAVCRELELDFSVEYILDFWKTFSATKLPEKMRSCINQEKILNDVYRYHILGERSLTSDWDFDNMVKI
jgi:hypothetical protein